MRDSIPLKFQLAQKSPHHYSVELRIGWYYKDFLIHLISSIIIRLRCKVSIHHLKIYPFSIILD